MPERCRIIITVEALSNLEDIAVYIRQHSPKNSSGVAETILNAIDSLAFMPNRFKKVGASRKRGTSVHAMVVRPFVVYYRVELAQAVVSVLSIRHGRRRQLRQFD